MSFITVDDVPGLEIIGLHGKAGSGKDTFADFIVECNGGFNGGWKKMALAQTVKDAASVLLHKPVEYMEGYKDTPLPELGVSSRKIYQELGEAMIDRIHPEFWVYVTAQRILQEYAQGVRKIIFTDVRYPCTARLIKDLEGHLVHIIRPKPSTWGFLSCLEPIWDTMSSVRSEKPLDESLIDKVIVNSKDLRWLRWQATLLL